MRTPSNTTNWQITDAVQESTELLKASPELTFIFQTHAMGQLADKILAPAEQELLSPIFMRTRPYSDEMNTAFERLKFNALQMYREVTAYRQGDSYFTKFGPVLSPEMK